VTSYFEIKVCVFGIFLENDKTNQRQFLLGFRRKHLFITTCIEKQCTRPLRELIWIAFKIYFICSFIFVDGSLPTLDKSLFMSMLLE